MKSYFLAAIALLLASSAAFADSVPAVSLGTAGHFQARLRGLAVVPDASATITIAGANIGGTTSASNSF
jgi:hypothetical protein